MKTAFCTHVSDDWYLPVDAQKLERSAKHFHPEIPFITFKSDIINEEFRKDPHGVNWCTIHPVVVSRIVNDYDLVIHFDADSLIVDRLDELMAGDFDLAGVRNNNDHGKAGADPGITFENVGIFQYLNAGLVASTRKDFWSDWIETTRSRDFPYGEQGALNYLFYSGKYKAKLLDPVESVVYYGIANCNGVGPANHYASWREIQLRPNGLYLWNKKVKVLHQAGAMSSQRFQPHLFSPDVLNWLQNLTGTVFTV